MKGPAIFRLDEEVVDAFLSALLIWVVMRHVTMCEAIVQLYLFRSGSVDYGR